MGEMRFEVEVDPGQQMRDAIKEAIAQVGNLTIPYKMIAQSWFKSNKAIFSVKGKGKYDDLTANYKKEKEKAVGFVYPILRRSGALEESITNPTSSKSVNKIINGKILLLGTSIEYGPPHQSGAPSINLPKRPFVLLGPEQVAPSGINKRHLAWMQLIKDHCIQQTLKAGVGSKGE